MQMVHLVWSGDIVSDDRNSVQKHLIEAYSNLYITNFSALDSAVLLIGLTTERSLAELTSLEKLVCLLYNEKKVSTDVITQLWIFALGRRMLHFASSCFPLLESNNSDMLIRLLLFMQRKVQTYLKETEPRCCLPCSQSKIRAFSAGDWMIYSLRLARNLPRYFTLAQKHFAVIRINRVWAVMVTAVVTELCLCKTVMHAFRLRCS
jgi:hypothetical protein